MPERLSRTIFVFELIIFALPCVYGLGIYAILFGGWTLAALLVLLGFAGYGLATLAYRFVTEGPSFPTQVPPLPKAAEIGEAIGLFALPLGAFILSACGAIALLKFVWVATDFTLRGRGALYERRRMLYSGLAWAVPPLALMLPMGMTGMLGDHPGDRLGGFYVSGLPLAVPILHLWLELRYRQKGARPSRCIESGGSDEKAPG